MTYSEYLSRAKACTQIDEAEELIEQAAEDYTISSRQFYNIRHVAIASAYRN